MMCHVTTVISFFIIQEKEKEKKRNIKSGKIDKKKRKMFKFRCIITSRSQNNFWLQLIYYTSISYIGHIF